VRTTISRLAAAGALGVAAVTGVVVAGAALMPAGAAETVAGADDGATEDQPFLAQRLQDIKDALSGLVGDGTITQEQADKVAEALNGSDALGHHGPGGGLRGLGPGVGLDAAAEALGMSAQDLRSALQRGSTLADVAQEQGVETSALVDALVTAAQERLDAAVADGRIPQQRADELAGTLEQEITEHLDDPLPLRGPGDGRGRGHHGDA
jgi:uncharacterized protein YidB (DUF937 family)